MSATRNREGIADAEIRAQVDPTFEALHDALETAYYKFWRQGRSQPWQGYDVQATPAQSKALFDDLHGAIFHAREVALDVADQQRPVNERIRAARRLEADGRTKREASEAWLASAAQRGIVITP